MIDQEAWGACVCACTHTHMHTYTLHFSEMWKPLSCFWHFETPWTIQSMELSRPEYLEPSRWLFPSPGDLPNPGIETRSPTLQANSLPAGHQGSLQSSEALCIIQCSPCPMLWTHMIFRGFPKQRILELNYKIRRVGRTVVLKQHCWDKI